MRRKARRWGGWPRLVPSGVLSALVCGAATALAQQGAAPAPAPGAQKEPAEWLRFMGRAARQSNYDGVVMINAGGRVSAAEVSHRHAGAQQFERVAPLDGPERHIYRRNDEVSVLWPGTRTALVQHRDAGAGPARPWGHADERILDFYAVDVLGQQRWAGQPAVVLLLKPRDEFRHAQRVWAQQRSGLVLRTDTLAPQGQVLEWTGFTRVTLAGPLPAWQPPDVQALEGWRVVRSALRKTTLRDEGWQVGDLPPGFRLLNCVQRPRPDATSTAAAPSPAASVPGQGSAAILQATFGDGVAHVSVFIEPFDAKRHGRELLLSQGATQTLKRRVGDWWLTVMGDVPAVTVQRFGAAFRRL